MLFSLFAQVCEGDLIVADVKNHMSGRSTTIHWHGVKMRNYKFMDGVPMVTQCPIHESTIFRYTFRAEDYGLQFYHSHDGTQIKSLYTGCQLCMEHIL